MAATSAKPEKLGLDFHFEHLQINTDSTEIPVYGQQENSAYNGHFESTSYHLLLLFNRGATVWLPNCVPETFTAPMAPRACCCRDRTAQVGG